ncbi:MAG: CARDB domain-containing protein [Nanoarchaeota archaeon]|nr:CARDB domain-containing protein [Nanoarchaeota archaeon]
MKRGSWLFGRVISYRKTSNYKKKRNYSFLMKRKYPKNKRLIIITSLLAVFVLISLTFIIYSGSIQQKTNSNPTKKSSMPGFGGGLGDTSKNEPPSEITLSSSNVVGSGGGGGGGSSSRSSSSSPDLSELSYSNNNLSSKNLINTSNSSNETVNENLTISLSVNNADIMSNNSPIIPQPQSRLIVDPATIPTSDSGTETQSVQARAITDPSGSIIKFTTFPSFTLCNNYDDPVNFALGLGTVNLNLGWDYSTCQVAISFSPYRWDIPIKYCLIEDDFTWGWDQIVCNYETATTYNCNTLNLENYHRTTVKRKFDNINLRNEFYDDLGEGSKIEIFASVSNDKNYFSEYRTSSNYELWSIYSDTCDCVSGDCCSSSRPFRFKTSGSQPTGKTDYYYCSGSNSPFGGSSVKYKDYYCTGSSKDSLFSTFTTDTCGTCEFCQEGDSTCWAYNGYETCGTRDCDYLDTSCRDYSDVDKGCVVGSCTSYQSCNSYTDVDKGTSCGTNKKCDGLGGCTTCTSHIYTGCSEDDIYWYNQCDDREERRWECGDDSEGTTWYPYCSGDQLWKKKTCINKGCSSNTYCDYEEYDCYNTYVKTCEFGCETVLDGRNARCKPDPNIICRDNYDCGIDLSSTFCRGKEVYIGTTYYTCNYPGTPQSSCTSDYYESLKEVCIYGCSNGECELPAPDLTITDLVVQRINGKNVTLAFTVKNIGNVIANSVYWKVDSDSEDGDPSRTTPTALSPGNWTRAYMMLTYLNSGNYNPAVIVDFDNLIVESNEINNEASISINV